MKKKTVKKAPKVKIVPMTHPALKISKTIRMVNGGKLPY
jgi:hypothetical protein